jgi:hypothetical protein
MKRNVKKNRKKWVLPLAEVIRDIRNYRKWIRTVKEEEANPNSKFNKYGLSHNYFYILYLAVTLPQEEAVLPDNIKRLRVVEMLTPIHQYLDNDLGFADYIVPEFNQFYDEEGTPTLAYGIVYRFAFKKLSIKWVVTRALFLSALIWALLKFFVV